MIVERQKIPQLNAPVGGSKILEEQICSSFRGCHATSPLKSVFLKKGFVMTPNKATQLSLTYFEINI